MFGKQENGNWGKPLFAGFLTVFLVFANGLPPPFCWYIAQFAVLHFLKFLFFPLKYDLISHGKYGTIISLDVR